MLTVPGMDVLTVADMVVVLAVLTGVNVLMVTGMGVLSVAGSRLLGLCFPSVSLRQCCLSDRNNICVFPVLYL